MNLKHARFCFNNFVESGFYSASSSMSNNPATNLVSGIRSKTWKAEGLFTISSQNNKVYINSTTYTLTAGSYTASTLITHFNSVTSQTLSRNSNGKFIITLGSSGTVNFSNQTNAVWSTLGFLVSTDATGTVFTADDRRYNNGEWIKTDTQIPQSVTFACLIPKNEQIFSLASAQSIKLQGNNVDIWDSPQVEVDMEVSSAGAFACPSDTLDPCRYWRIYIDDKTNSSIEVSVAYIGSSVVTENTNMAIGFSRKLVDPSQKVYSESGQLYVDRKPRYTMIESVNVMYLKDDDLEAMENLYYDLGQGRPFFIVIDPQTEVSRSIDHMTYYVQVDGDPVFQHVISGYHNLSFTLREVI